MRRKALRHRAFSIFRAGEFVNISSHKKSSAEIPAITLIFNGQGAQWAGMGKELLNFDPLFKNDIEIMDAILSGLPKAPNWTIRGKHQLLLCLTL